MAAALPINLATVAIHGLVLVLALAHRDRAVSWAVVRSFRALTVVNFAIMVAVTFSGAARAVFSHEGIVEHVTHVVLAASALVLAAATAAASVRGYGSRTLRLLMAAGAVHAWLCLLEETQYGAVLFDMDGLGKPPTPEPLAAAARGINAYAAAMQTLCNFNNCHNRYYGVDLLRFWFLPIDLVALWSLRNRASPHGMRAPELALYATALWSQGLPHLLQYVALTGLKKRYDAALNEWMDLCLFIPVLVLAVRLLRLAAGGETTEVGKRGGEKKAKKDA